MNRLNSSLMLLAGGLVVMALAVWLAARSVQPPQPASAAGQFDAAAALQVLDNLAAGGEPRPVGSAANRQLRSRLLAAFTDLGYEASEQHVLACRVQWASCAFATNVVARLPDTAGQPSVLMTAHHDSVGAGPGIADDLAGVAALLEVARLQRDAQASNPLLFVISDAEEVGLLGAEGFLRHEAFADVAAVVNVEARGTSGQSLLFETGADNAWITGAFAEAASTAAMNSLYYELYRLLPNDTDFSVYREAGLQGLNFAAIGGVRRYHTPLDSREYLSADTLQHHGDNLLAAARALADADLSQQPEGDALFLTILPGLVFRLPVSWGFWLSLTVLVLWFAAAARLLGSGQVSGGGLLLGVVFPLAALLLAAAAGQFSSWLLPELSGQLLPWWSRPVPSLLAMAAAAMTAVTATALIPAGRSGFWGLALGVWFWFGLAGFLLLEWLPGASVVFLVPAMVIAAAFGLTALSPGRSAPAAAGVAAWLALLAAATVWLPLAWNLEQALGAGLGAGIALCVALASLPLMPLMAVPRPQRPLAALLPVAGVIAATAAVAWALRVPVFTPDSPPHLSILHLESAENGEFREAAWLLDTVPAAPLPGGFSGFGETPGPALPWSGWLFHRADSSQSVTAWPQLEVQGQNGDSLRVRLSSGRDAQELHLFVPPAAGLTQIAVADSGYVIDYSDWPDSGFRRFSCYGPECNGLELELRFSGLAPFDVLISDQTFGLPAGGAALQAARGELAVPWQDGDVTLAINRQSVSLP